MGGIRNLFGIVGTLILAVILAAASATALSSDMTPEKRIEDALASTNPRIVAGSLQQIPEGTPGREQVVAHLAKLREKEVAMAAAQTAAAAQEAKRSIAKVKVNWTEDYGATATSDAIHRKNTTELPVFYSSPACKSRFTVKAIAAKYSCRSCLFDFSPKLTLSVRKEFQGRGEEPAFKLITRKDGMVVTTLDFDDAINASKWPSKGYTFSATFNLKATKDGKPPDWKELRVSCE